MQLVAMIDSGDSPRGLLLPSRPPDGELQVEHIRRTRILVAAQNR